MYSINYRNRDDDSNLACALVTRWFSDLWLEWVGRAQARAMMGAPKCCSHTLEGYASREKSDLCRGRFLSL